MTVPDVLVSISVLVEQSLLSPKSEILEVKPLESSEEAVSKMFGPVEIYNVDCVSE